MSNIKNIEIERRFLLKKIPSNVKIHKLKHTLIKQWYVSRSPVIRLRSENDKKYVLCIKTKPKSNVKGEIGRSEHEFDISYKEFCFLLKKSSTKAISKTRYEFPLSKTLTAEIDVFHSHKGLIIVEVEFKNENAAKKFKVPVWIGKEITGVKKYANANLAKDL